ncbi:MAG: hypothetical protein QM627_02760 [Luteolibacter sp.]
MKAMPTLEGGLRLDTEDPSDWEFLRAIVTDAQATTEHDLAERLGRLIPENAGGEDWEEFVVPDLREMFQDELAEVAAAIESAVVEADGGAGPVWINPENASQWYSTLNQARLNLEEIFRFGTAEDLDPTMSSPMRAAAFIRSKFYCTIQSLLLEYVMR